METQRMATPLLLPSFPSPSPSVSCRLPAESTRRVHGDSAEGDERGDNQRMATSGVAASICNAHSSMVARLACSTV